MTAAQRIYNVDPLRYGGHPLTRDANGRRRQSTPGPRVPWAQAGRAEQARCRRQSLAANSRSVR